MIREFDRTEVLETFVDVAREKSPIFRVDQSTSVELNPVLHSAIKETIERVIKKASPDLSVVIQVDPIHNELYGHINKFEPVFSQDPSDVHFYITREAVPASYRFTKGEILTVTHIGIDYYYPASWAMTPPRDEKAAIRRTMDEILFAWTIVSKTLLSTPIVRFDDEDEAAEAVFTFANTLLFNSVVTGYYYKQDFISRLMDIERTLRCNQHARGKDLATIVLPKDNKIGSLDVPVVDIENNKITQFVRGYVAYYGQERRWEYSTVLKAFTLYDERFDEGVSFPEEDLNNYLESNVGQPVGDYVNYNMRRIQRLVVNGNSKAARPPMIDMTFKGIGFTNVCPFTYGARSLTYIHFEKDIISHLERVFKHSNTEYATDIAKGIKLPEGDRVNEKYDIDPRLIGLFQLSRTTDPLDKEVYRNKGLYLAAEEAAKQDLEANAQKAVKENIRSMEANEESVAEGVFIECTSRWSDVPF